MKVKVTQSCSTVCDPMNYTVHGILQARILELIAFPFSRGFSQPRDRTQVSRTAGGFFTSWATWEVTREVSFASVKKKKKKKKGSQTRMLLSAFPQFGVLKFISPVLLLFDIAKELTYWMRKIKHILLIILLHSNCSFLRQNGNTFP